MAKTHSPPPEPEAPGFLAYIPLIGHHLAREWPVIRAAPGTIIVVAVIAAALSAVGMSWFYGERMATYEARDKYLSGEIEDYRKAFPGKSPDEAAKEMAELRGQFDNLNNRVDSLVKKAEPRHLTAAQEEIIHRGLEQINTTTSTIPVFAVSEPRGETYGYAKDFVDVLQTSGFLTGEPILGGVSKLDQVGVMVGYSSTMDHPPEVAVKLKKVLEDAGLRPHYTEWTGILAPNMIDIFIGMPD